MTPQRTAAIRWVFGLVALVGAAVGAWYAYRVTSSWALVFFVFFVVSFVVGRGTPDLITDPEKGKRLGYFGIPPVLAVAALAGAYRWWETWWLAVVIGFVVYFFGAVLATLLFPRIAEEETQDDLTRAGLPAAAGPTPRPTVAPQAATSQHVVHDRSTDDRPGAPGRPGATAVLDAEAAVRLLREIEETTGVDLEREDEVRFVELAMQGRRDEAIDLVVEKSGGDDGDRRR